MDLIDQLAESCYQHGVRYAVFSPGSRNAPISASFGNHQRIESFVIVDERSAGFIALGIAEASQTPVVLCCTSGTALLNYGPAIAEAFYKNIPLIILSADRPPEWIDQWDGQTIRQQNVFSNHIRFFHQMPVDRSHPDAIFEYERSLSQAFAASKTEAGPVHLNFPFREPFYPEHTTDKIEFVEQKKVYVVDSPSHTLSKSQQENLIGRLISADRILFVIGQGDLTEEECKLISQLGQKKRIAVLSDIISNADRVSPAIQKQDWFLGNRQKWKELEPDLIISCGKSLISKNLKLFLRNSQASQIHVSEKAPSYSNPYQTEIQYLQSDLNSVIKIILESEFSGNEEYFNQWVREETQAESQSSQEIASQPFSEILAFYDVMRNLPEDIDLHLANSMAVRYANLIGWHGKGKVIANRGTSGIDGTNGTAVGYSLISQRKNILLTGDLSFLYDRNAFFHEYDLSNLFVVVFNNFGGGIFDMIPGPAKLGETLKEKYFNTVHNRDMKEAAQESGLSYFKANDEVTLSLALSTFFESTGKPKLLEIQTNQEINQRAFKAVKSRFS